MMYFSEVADNESLSRAKANALIATLVQKLDSPRRVLIIPPDFTRRHSFAGLLTSLLYEHLKQDAEIAILPALGTHHPMTKFQIEEMYAGIPEPLFHVHNWREDLHKLGEVPSDFISAISDGTVDYSITCEVNKLLIEKEWDAIISVGQVVPHEVAGMANQSKNIFVGTGGIDTINKTHFLGAACGMENIMGRCDNPVRAVLDYMSDNFGQGLPIVYLLSVVANSQKGVELRGLFCGDDQECFKQAADLSRRENVIFVDEPIKKVVVHLDPNEFRSTWLGNKSIYRTRMMLADGGELIVLAPGVDCFGEDKTIDDLIRRFGYCGTPQVLKFVAENKVLRENLSAAAHLIHGSSEGRFRITYCTSLMGAEEVQQVGYGFSDYNRMIGELDCEDWKDGWNRTKTGEDVYFISRPGLGLWSTHSAFDSGDFT